MPIDQQQFDEMSDVTLEEMLDKSASDEQFVEGVLIDLSDWQEFASSAMWQGFMKVLENMLESLRVAQDDEMNVMVLRIRQGQIAQLKEVVLLPAMVIDELRRQANPRTEDDND